MKEAGEERLTIQKVSPRFYPASYPAWFMDISKFRKMFDGKYELVADFDTFDLGEPWAIQRGFFFKKT